MITIRIKGGLGNQLFQYASGYAMAKRRNEALCLDTSFFLGQSLRGYKLSSLNLEHQEIVEELPAGIRVLKSKYINKLMRILKAAIIPCGKKNKYLLETVSDIVPEYFTLESAEIYVDGYFQSAKYFEEFRESLLRQFTVNYDPETEYLEALDEIRSVRSVAVHVRRGDFLKVQYSSNPNQYLLSEAYYHHALKYMDEHVEQPVYFWFSDDIEWVKQNFGEKDNFRFVTLRTKHGDIDEMMLMKNCHHIIAANSTFSWWASWLNEHEDALHLCPAKRYGNLHMIPDEWIKIPVE